MNLNECCGTVQGPGIIYQSADTPINFSLTNPDGSPFDLTSAAEIWAMFPTLVNPPVIFKLTTLGITITNAGGGLFTGTMSSVNALLLKLGLIDVEVRVTIGSVISVAQILQQVTVDPSLFPGY